ncbi:MAG: hypothetical protein KGJ90_03950 [Patescibacteria group bacterium]|nr:hypothetical protein [Patescibacteria group bacterium]
MLFLRADLSQAESRVTYALSHNDELIELARKKPWEFDVHRYIATIIFDKPSEEITNLQRYATKKVTHGTHYDMQPERMSDTLLKEGFSFTPTECNVLQRKYLQRFPAIRDSYHYRCRMKCIQKRYLENSWGRRIYFTYERLGPELYRRLYAWTPQSEVGDLLNQWGFIPAVQFIDKYNFKSRVNLQVHDEVCISVTPDNDEAWDLMRLLAESLEREREYEGVKLSIPVSLTLETRYHAEEHEFKQFPSYGEYKEVMAKLWESRMI